METFCIRCNCYRAENARSNKYKLQDVVGGQLTASFVVCVNSRSTKFCEHYFVSVRCRCSRITQNAHKIWSLGTKRLLHDYYINQPQSRATDNNAKRRRRNGLNSFNRNPVKR